MAIDIGDSCETGSSDNCEVEFDNVCDSCDASGEENVDAEDIEMDLTYDEHRDLQGNAHDNSEAEVGSEWYVRTNSLIGTAGNDYLGVYGDENEQVTITAGAGNDFLTANNRGGNTTLTGGNGADIFSTNGWTFFVRPEDRADLAENIEVVDYNPDEGDRFIVSVPDASSDMFGSVSLQDGNLRIFDDYGNVVYNAIFSNYQEVEITLDDIEFYTDPRL